MMEYEMRISKEFSLGSNEEFIKELNEAIEELEALESRSCDSCLHYDSGYCTNLHLDKMLDEFQEVVGFVRVYKGFGCKLWEAKQ